MATTPNSNPGSNPNQLSEKDLKRLIDLLQKIDKLSEVAAINMANQAQSAGNARQQLDRLEGEWNDITGDISYATKGFKEIQEAIKNTNEGINASVKVYKVFGSIAEDIQRYQRDISQMSEKDVTKLREKVEAQKLNLETANELLKDNKTDIEGEQKTLDLLKSQNELAQKNYQTLIDSLKQKEKTHGLSKTETNNLEKFTESLKETKREYTSINNQIKDNNTSLTQIESTLIQNNAALKGFDGLVEGVELTLQRLSKEVRFKNVEDLDKHFKNIIEESQSTDENLSKITKSFTSISSIAQKVEDHQSGANKLSEKDAKKLLEKLESERKSLSNRYELLKLEEQRLKVSKKSNQETLDNTKQEIDILEAKSSLTKDEEEKLKTFKTQYQTLSQAQNKITEDLEVNEVLQEKISGYIDKQNKAYNTTVDNLEKIKKQQENIRKASGLGGLAIESLGKAFSKMGLGGLSSAMGLDEAKEKMKEISEEITNGGEKAAGLVGKFKVLGAGLSVIGKNIFSYLTDPLTLVTGLVAGVVASVKGLISLFEESAKFTGDISKSFGLSADEASRIGDNLRSAAGSDFFMTTEESRKAFDMMANATGVINESFSNSKAVTAMNDLVTYAGYSTEEAEKLYSLSQLNNQSVDDTVSSLQGQLKVLQVNNKLRINEKQAVEMVAKASATVRMNLGANPKKLADAAFYASKLGMTLDEISSAAEQTLNFESAIQNQLEYQVLTGKEINIDAYQQAAASGDAAAASKELNKLIEEQGPNIEKNTFAQEALSKTLGISREQLMKSIQLQKLQKKLGGEQVDIEKAINLKMKEGLSYEEAAAEVGKDGYKSILEQNKNAQVFSRTVAEIKESFMTALSGSEGFKKLFSKENIAGYVETIQNDIIPAVTKLAELAGEFIEYLSKPENIQVLKDGFNGLIDTVKSLKEPIKWVIENLGTIVKVLGAIILLNFAGKFIGNITSMGKAVGGLISSLGKAGSLMTGLGKSKIPSATPSVTPSPSPTPSPAGGGGGRGGNQANNFTKGINANAMLKGAAAILVLSAALYVAAKAFQEFGQVKWEDVAKGTVALGALTLAAYGVSKIEKDILKGALAIGVLGASLIPAAFALKMFTDIKWEDMAKAGVALVGLGAAGAIFGSILPLMLSGAVAIAALGASLLPLAAALRLAGPGLESFGEMVKSVLEGIVPVIDTAGKAIKGVLEGIGSVIESVGKSISGVVTSIADSIVKLSSIDAPNLYAVAGGIGALGVSLAAFGGGGILAGVGSAIGEFFGGDPVEKFNKFASIDAEQLNTVSTSINNVSTSMSSFQNSLDSEKINSISNSIESLGEKLVSFYETDFSDTEVAAQLQELTNIDSSKIVTLAEAIAKLSESFSGLNGTLSNMGDIAPVVTVTEEFVKLHKTVTATPLEQAVESVKTGVKNTYEQAKSWVTSLVSDAAVSQKLNVSQTSDSVIQMRDGVVQVQDGNLNPNGGLVISKFQKGQLQPVAQGIKEDKAYLTPNSISPPETNINKNQSVVNNAVNNNAVNNTSSSNTSTANIDSKELLVALKAIENVLTNINSKEGVVQLNGQTVGKVLSPIIVREINNTSISV